MLLAVRSAPRSEVQADLGIGAYVLYRHHDVTQKDRHRVIDLEEQNLIPDLQASGELIDNNPAHRRLT